MKLKESKHTTDKAFRYFYDPKTNLKPILSIHKQMGWKIKLYIMKYSVDIKLGPTFLITFIIVTNANDFLRVFSPKHYPAYTPNRRDNIDELY